jgi:hypothetical protein
MPSAEFLMLQRFGGLMQSSRRELIRLSIAAGAVAAAAATDLAQDAKQRSPVSASGEPVDSAPELDPNRKKEILEQNKKDMKKDIERLFQLASELKEEADKTDSVNTLSLALLRKTEEIEKLSRQIREKAKG